MLCYSVLCRHTFMNKEFQKYTLDDFLEDTDFCSWVDSRQPELPCHYDELLEQFPDKRETFYSAYYLLSYLQDQKYVTSPEAKIQKWNKVLSFHMERPKARNLTVFLRYAAILFAFIAISSLVWYGVQRSAEDILATHINLHEYSETTLLLGEEQEYFLSGTQSRLEYIKDRREIIANGALIKDTLAESGKALNQLIVPYGKQAKIVLEDQTVVWLNAGSRLLFPSAFDKKERLVYLDGEAFFEVSKNKHKPFMVAMHNSRIRVLGTSFNVKSYADEKSDEAILVEGSISLSFAHSILADDIILKPEERIVVNSDQSFSVSSVDVQNSIAWREGILVFEKETLSSVFARISRFYGLDIECVQEDSGVNKKISGKLDLTKSYQNVFKSLALILGGGNYSEENGKIIFKLKCKNE